MKHYEEIITYNEDYKLAHTKGYKYINIACSLDIETSSLYIDDDKKVSCSYVWAVCLGFDNVYYGRTWQELLLFCKFLQSHFSLDTKRRLIIYVHNLGYEFQFMRKYFEWETIQDPNNEEETKQNIFSVKERKPLKAVSTLGIEFRCSFMLSGMSLERTAKNLLHFKLDKLNGALDYELVRHEETPLKENELLYLEHDVKIVCNYINEQILIYGDIAKVPLTNTGRVRQFVKHNCYYTSKTHKKTSRDKNQKYKNIMLDLQLDKESYALAKSAYMGGFTHANAFYSGKTLESVSSLDFTSSYPSVMLSELFPMSTFTDVRVKNFKHFKELCNKYAMLFNIRFKGIKNKIGQEVYLSEHKCRNVKKAIVNNGRIWQAEQLETTLTEIDFLIMEQVYTWESIEYSNVKKAYKGYLPKAILTSILELYQKKTVLKGVKGQEVEYVLSKGMLNSIYGMCVTDPLKDDIVYKGNVWTTSSIDIEKKIQDINESKNRFLYYPWGVWVTAYARRNLWTGILALEDDYIYSDTDSIKLLNYEEHKEYFNNFNNDMKKKLLRMCEHNKIDVSLLSPKTQDGVIQFMGLWDFEGTYKKFKTLGAKRYLYENEKGKHTLTVAGLSKENGLIYMQEIALKNGVSVFDLFNNSLYIPKERTGKMTHTYIDESISFICIDYLGNKKEVTAHSGTHLEKCDFTLDISKEYLEFLSNLQQGYIYKGLDYEQ